MLPEAVLKTEDEPFAVNYSMVPLLIESIKDSATKGVHQIRQWSKLVVAGSSSGGCCSIVLLFLVTQVTVGRAAEHRGGRGTLSNAGGGGGGGENPLAVCGKRHVSKAVQKYSHDYDHRDPFDALVHLMRNSERRRQRRIWIGGGAGTVAVTSTQKDPKDRVNKTLKLFLHVHHGFFLKNYFCPIGFIFFNKGMGDAPSPRKEVEGKARGIGGGGVVVERKKKKK